ncbi:hypothetical protein GCM10008018_58460 [Paenibacillus marchantiophytorum]|uniref:Uncharacterized protein n=1 Tax=Paenibacillus marchantiophytorum TaxID=1619310 RepID=A0ABQ1FB59_9BACL|nr:hypothetical protein [Paenibacillus marchantiophytorum]GGA04891.1 hypothetical protein GCM10008018_58460 [Paenibacillus marchantiophytorum]
MENLRSFLLTIFAWILFAVSGFIFLKHESIGTIHTGEAVSQQIAPAKYTGTADLTSIKGEQLIGMVPSALAGNFQLIIDGLSITDTTDITTVDLRGVPGLSYNIRITRDAVGNIATIRATH